MESHNFLIAMHQELNIDLFKQDLKYSDSHVILKSKVNSSINVINECLSIKSLSVTTREVSVRWVSFVYGLVLLFIVYKIISSFVLWVNHVKLWPVRLQAIAKPYIGQKSIGKFHIVNIVMSRVSECNIFSKSGFKPILMC